MADGSGLDLARHWLEVGRPERALEQLTRLPAEEGLSREAFVLRAASLHDLDRDEDAAAAAETGLGQYGPDPQLLAVLGTARWSANRYEDAERAMLDGLALAPTSVYLLCTYARVCVEVGQVEKAARLVDRAASYEPEDELVAQARVLIAYAAGNDDEALQRSRDALRLGPDEAANHALFAMASGVRGDVAAAARSYRRAAAAEPGNLELVEAAREARAAAHPLLWPLRLLQRFGVFPVWLGAVAIIVGLRALDLPMLALGFGLVWVLYCIYSWVAPPLVGRWLRRKR